MPMPFARTTHGSVVHSHTCPTRRQDGRRCGALVIARCACTADDPAAPECCAECEEAQALAAGVTNLLDGAAELWAEAPGDGVVIRQSHRGEAGVAILRDLVGRLATQDALALLRRERTRYLDTTYRLRLV